MSSRNRIAIASIALISIAGAKSADAGPGFGPAQPGGAIERSLRADERGKPIVYVVRENAEVKFDGFASGDARMDILSSSGQPLGKLDIKAGKQASLEMPLKKGSYILVLRALSARAKIRIDHKPLPIEPDVAQVRLPQDAAIADGGRMQATQGPAAKEHQDDARGEEAAGKLSAAQGKAKAKGMD